MAEVEHKIRVVTTFEDGVSQPLKEAKGKVLDFGKAAEKAGRDVSKAFDNQAVSAKGVGSAFTLLHAKTLAVVAATATLTALISKAVREAIDYEAGMNRLATNLSLVGIKSSAFINSLQAQAQAFQETTKFSDDAVISVQSMLLAFGVAPSKLKQATQAVVDFSAATGRDLNSVADDVGRTFGGFSGQLGRLIPEIAVLTEKQLKAGDAVTILGNRFAGAASRDAQSFAGAMAQLNNAWKDFLKSIGEFIIHIPAVQSGVKLLVDTFNALKNSISPDKGNTAIDRKLTELRSLAEQLEQTANPNQGAGTPAKIAADRLKEVNAEIRDLFRQQNEEKTKTAKLIQDELDASDKAIQLQNAKLAAIEAEKKAKEELKQLEKERLDLEERMQNMLDDLAKKRIEDEQKALEHNVTATSGALIGGSAAGLVTVLAGPIAGGIAELVVNAGKLPDQISKIIGDLAEGIGKGIPKLVEYLGSDFIPELVAGLATAIAGLIKNLPSIGLNLVKLGVRSGLAIATGGLSEAIGALAGLFGGGKSESEKVRDALKKLTDVIATLNTSLQASARGIISQIATPEQAFSSASSTFTDLRSERLKKIDEYLTALEHEDAEKAAAILKEIADLQVQMMQSAKQGYDIQIKQLDDIQAAEQKKYDLERQAIEAQIASLRGLRQTAIDTMRSAREAILGESLGPTANLARLQSAFQSAGTPEAKSAAASALAGGLQTQFSMFQNLAAQGAITGEEFQRIQADILAQLSSTETESTNYFDRLISVQEQQLVSLDDNFKTLVDSIDKQRQELKEQLIKVVDLLSKLPEAWFREFSNGVSFNNPMWPFQRSFDENRSNLRGKITTRI